MSSIPAHFARTHRSLGTRLSSRARAVVVPSDTLRKLRDLGRRNDVIAAIIRDVQSEVLGCDFTIGLQEGGTVHPASDTFQKNVLERYWRPMLREAVWHLLIYGFYCVTFARPKQRPVTTTDLVPLVVDSELYDLVFETNTYGQREYFAYTREGVQKQLTLMPFVMHHPSDDGEPQSPAARCLRHLEMLQQILSDTADSSFGRAHPPYVLQRAPRARDDAPTDEQLMERAGNMQEVALGMTREQVVGVYGPVLRDMMEDERTRRHGRARFRVLANPPPGFLDYTAFYELPSQIVLGNPPRPETLPDYQGMIQLLVSHICSVFGVSVDTVLQSQTVQRFATNIELVHDKMRRLTREFHSLLVEHMRIMYSVIYQDIDLDVSKAKDAKKRPHKALQPHFREAVPHFSYNPLVSMEELRQLWMDGIIDQKTYAEYALQSLYLPRELLEQMPKKPDVPEEVLPNKESAQKKPKKEEQK